MSNSQDWATNYIPINRKIFGHEFWEEKRVFSKFEAWMDLLQTARYEKEIKTDWINNKQVSYGRGQLPSSIRFLQKRWNWGSITKVERYLRLLENKDMVVLEKGQGQFVITICKYDTYNPLKKDERTVKGQGRGQQKDKSNKERNNNIDSSIDSETSFGNDCTLDLIEKEVPLYTAMVDVWFTDTHPDFVFAPIDGKKIKSIISKIQALLKKHNRVSGDKDVLNFFKLICGNLPEFFKDKDLKVIDSDFNQIIQKIKEIKNGKEFNNTEKRSTYSNAKAAFGA